LARCNLSSWQIEQAKCHKLLIISDNKGKDLGIQELMIANIPSLLLLNYFSVYQ